MARAIGLHLGHGACRTAVLRPSGEATIVLNGANERATPSAVARHEGEWAVGRPAVELAARQTVVLDPLSNLAAGLVLPLDAASFEPAEVLAALLSRLRRDATLRLGDEIGASVMAVPSDLPAAHYPKVVAAAQRAGWPTPQVVPAGLAVVAAGLPAVAAERPAVVAVLDWEQDRLNIDLVLVRNQALARGADRLGGQTQAARADLLHLVTVSRPDLGASRWVDAVVDLALGEIRNIHGVDGRQQPRFLAELRRTATEAIRELESHESSCLVVIGRLSDGRGRVSDVEIELPRHRFSQIVAPSAEAAISTMLVVLRALGDDASTAGVILAGTAAKTFVLRQRLADLGGASRLLTDGMPAEPTEAAAIGAALLLVPGGSTCVQHHPDDPRALWRSVRAPQPDPGAGAPAEATTVLSPPEAQQPPEPATPSVREPGPASEQQAQPAAPETPPATPAEPETAVETVLVPQAVEPAAGVPEPTPEPAPPPQTAEAAAPEAPSETPAELESAVQTALVPQAVEPAAGVPEPTPEPAPPPQAAEAAAPEAPPETPAAPEPTFEARRVREQAPPESGGPAVPAPERYRLVRLLSRDTHVEVHLAEDCRTGRVVRLRLYDVSDRRARRGFERALIEVHLSQAVVDEIVDVGESGGHLFIATEGAGRESLRERMVAGQRGPVMPPAESATIALGIIRALRVVHGVGLFHRNVKPENVLLVAPDDAVRLTGFEVCTLLPPGQSDRAPAGTLYYMAPEVIQGRADHRADVYSAAVVLYEMLTGAVPFRDRTAERLKVRVMHERPIPPMAINRAVSEPLNAFVMRGLEKDPSRRRFEAAELRSALG